MIQLFHVSKTYGKDVEALVDITLHIKKGEFVFIAGSSGAGKTTLLRLLFRDERPTSGQILVGGRNVAKLGERHIPAFRRSLGIVFQDFKLLKDRSVFENLALVYRIRGLPLFLGQRKVRQLLKLVGLAHKADLYPSKLSGGEQQRVAIARALMNDPLILLADEPTGNLDDELAQDVIGLFRDVNARGTTVLVATHNLKIVEEMRRRTIFLKKGRIVEERL